MKKVLIVEDEESMMTLACDTLADDPELEVFRTNDGAEALRIAAVERPDIVLLDLVLPTINGWDVCRDLKTVDATKHAKVIMVSALAQESHRRLAAQIGAEAYITKPYRPTQLRDVVDAMLSSQM